MKSGNVNIVSKDQQGLLHVMKKWIINLMENSFHWYGKTVSQRPVTFILLCVVITGLCSIGFLGFHRENNGVKVWLPENSEFRVNQMWLWNHHPSSLRYATILFVAEDGGNILSADVIRVLYRISRQIAAIRTEFNQTWSDLCQKAPIMRRPDISTLMSLFGAKKRKRRRRQSSFSDDEDDDFFKFDDSDFDDFGDEDLDALDGNYVDIGEYYNVHSYPDPYCQVVNQLEFACLEIGLLELWGHDGKYDEQTDEMIQNLTDEQVLAKINSFNKSGIFLNEKNFTDFLSEVKYDEKSGQIVSASATFMSWLSNMNMTEALADTVTPSPEPVDAKTYAFEGEMLKIMFDTSDYPGFLTSYPHVGRSFGDVGVSAIFGDGKILLLGYLIVINYVYIMLGRFNCVEQRIYAGMAGIIAVIMGVFVCLGLSSAFGLFFGPMHSVLPFLLLGIGIDDMFVIVQCYENLRKRPNLEFHQRFGLTMQHAGVAITVTSLTDIVAFAIGGTSILPGLKSFCLYASVGIVAIYFFQCTFFLACLSLDQRRIDDKRNGFLPCIRHANWTPNKLSQREICRELFVKLATLLTKLPVKIIVIGVTLSLAGLSIYGNAKIKHEFDPTKFLPSDTYLAKWFDFSRQYFPTRGDIVSVHVAHMNLEENFPELLRISEELKGQSDILYGVESWPMDFRDYLERNFKNKSYDFEEKLVQFLFSPRGAKYKQQFTYETDLNCGDQSLNISMSFMKFYHFRFPSPTEAIPAMKKVKAIVAGANVTNGKMFPLARSYSLWETDDIIGAELYRNVGFAMICVFLTTLVLLANFRASIMVLVCVMLSLSDIGGFMYFWDLTIDTVSCNNLVIAIGLCIDYSSHIAHRFLIEPGSDRNERIMSTLANIGPAVLNGGFTTFFAFILLANSQSHVFITFFKVFFLVVTFGLYHGLIVLPVFLSLYGPEPHTSVQIIQAESNAVEKHTEAAQAASEPELDKKVNETET